jgi:hypothetical protein
MLNDNHYHLEMQRSIFQLDLTNRQACSRRINRFDSYSDILFYVASISSLIYFGNKTQ